MLVIRLSRVGTTNKASYRFVVQEKRKSPGSRVKEILGHYNPQKNPAEIVFHEDRIKYWLSKGAQPSATVHNLLVEKKLLNAPKVIVARAPKKEETKEEAAPKAVAATPEVKPVA